MTSEFSVPVFVSSTVYDLFDVRADLQEHLASRGFRPILSNDEGFPDKGSELEPWESCLPVLAECFVVVVIIDGRYGQPLKWPHYVDLFQDRQISPTHAEFLYAKAKHRRLFVFVRDRLLEFYQSYRKAAKLHPSDQSAMKAALEPLLPDWVSFESLAFLNEVKTTKPIPWICPFKDSRQLRLEIERKMINELYEYYTFQEERFDQLLLRFNAAFEQLGPEEQKKVLSGLGAGQELLARVQRSEEEAAVLQTKVGQLQGELETAKKERDALDQSKSVERQKMDKELKRKEQELEKAQKELNEKLRSELEEQRRKLSDLLSASSGHASIGTAHLTSGYSGSLLGGITLTPGETNSGCERCHSSTLGEFGVLVQCQKCGRKVCSKCRAPFGSYTSLGQTTCQDCASGGTGIFVASKPSR